MPPRTQEHDDDVRRGLDLALFRKLLAYARAYRRHFLHLLLVMLVYSGLDAGMPLLTRAAIDRFATTGNTGGILAFSLVCLAFALGRGIAVRFMILAGAHIHTGISYDLRRDGFAHLQTLPFAYFDRHAVGWLMSRLTADSVELARFFAWGLVDLVDGLGKLLLMTGIMLYLDPKLALAVLAVVPFMALVVARSQIVTMEKFRQVRRLGSEVTGALNEGVAGALTTKTLVRETAADHEFGELTRQLRELSVEAARRAAVYFPIVLFFGTVGSALAVWLGGNGVLAGQVSYGTLVAFLAYAANFFGPLQDLARRFPQLQNAQACAERLFSLLETPAEATVPAVASPPPACRGHLVFDQVSFAYSADEPVLTDFNLVVKPGETIALVGETGVGKTTVTSLLCRFYEPTAGRILLDGVDLRDLPLDQLRGQIGIVLQTPHLFSGSLRDNLRYGRLDATDQEIEAAARAVGAHDFILDCHGGYDFAVGENGANLSAGQRQLVALARVVLANPQLLILDEATSSVDTETEQRLQAAIEQLLHGRTSFVIAHRLSTIRHADRILLLGRAGLVEAGTHRELIHRRGAYFQLYSSQFLEHAQQEILQQT